ncbi:hypothetical protein KAU33_04365 [Candidatus Dependentiae bacterium]|nr:hypothetical protein [Candidatus Dependentiae bacterium]
MENKKPNKKDLKTIRTKIMPKLEEIRNDLEIDPETLGEMVRKSRELSALSIEDMFYTLRGLTNYRCEAEEYCNSCPLLCTFVSGEPRLGRIHHPKIPMPSPNLIRKAPADKSELELLREVWSGF